MVFGVAGGPDAGQGRRAGSEPSAPPAASDAWGRGSARVTCPTLVCVGDLDPVTPVAAAREIAGGLPPGMGQLEVIEGAGHFPWLDRADRYWTLLTAFVARVTLRPEPPAHAEHPV